MLRGKWHFPPHLLCLLFVAIKLSPKEFHGDALFNRGTFRCCATSTGHRKVKMVRAEVDTVFFIISASEGSKSVGKPCDHVLILFLHVCAVSRRNIWPSL